MPHVDERLFNLEAFADIYFRKVVQRDVRLFFTKVCICCQHILHELTLKYRTLLPPLSSICLSLKERHLRRLTVSLSTKICFVWQYYNLIIVVIMKYMGDLPTGVVNETLAAELLSRGQTMAEIRDEIYCQICKQLNRNTRKLSIQRGLELLGVSFTVDSFSRRDIDLVRSVCYPCPQAQHSLHI